jgi:hypothetical protein
MAFEVGFLVYARYTGLERHGFDGGRLRRVNKDRAGRKLLGWHG